MKATVISASFARVVLALMALGGQGLISAGEKPDVPPYTVKHVEAGEAAKLVAKGDVVVLDVRTPKEFSAGHIAGATNINYNSPDFAKQLDKLDKSKPYLLLCASGHRSTRSLPILEMQGFKYVIHLDGGFNAWQAAKNPVEKQ